MRFPTTSFRRSPFTLAACVTAAITASGAGAATLHSYATTVYRGSEGAVATNNSSPTGGALEATTGAPDTKFATPFGLLGEYNASATTPGIGVAGTSTSSYGVFGVGTGPMSSIYATYGGPGNFPVAGTAAVEGHTTSTGTSTHGVAGYADSANADGIFGFDRSGSLSGDGVFGESKSGTGIIAVLSETTSSHQAALLALGNTATTGKAELGLEDGQAVVAFGNPVVNAGVNAPVVEAIAENPASQVIAGLSVAQTGGNQYESFIVQGNSQNRSTFVNTSVGASDVQIQGDVYLTGRIYQGCSAFPVTSAATCGSAVGSDGSGMVAVRTRSGETVQAFTSKQATPTFEDAGESSMIAGSAHVRLDPTFASTISGARPYLVFVTPLGDSGQLFVTNRTPSGFDVRESRGGRSTLAFDYRIVAKPAESGQTDRMAIAAPAIRPVMNGRAIAKAPTFTVRAKK